MNYKYKRSFIFIRQSSSVKFYSETVDFIGQLKNVVPNHIKITTTKQNENIEFISFWFPEFEDYKWFTENLYISGELKLIFRNAMIYTKANKFAFCLPSINLQNKATNSFTRYWYYYLKSPEEKFYDTTPGHKDTLKLLTYIVGMPECLHSTTIFDFEHNLKFTEDAILDTVSIKGLHRRFFRMYKRILPEYMQARQEYNQLHNIKYDADIDTVTRLSSTFDLSVIKNLLPEKLNSLILNLEL